MTRIVLSATAAIAFGCALTGTGAAQAENTWQYNIKPYGWYVWFDGDTGAEGDPPVSSDSSLLDMLDGFFLIKGAAQRGKLSILAEFNWVDMSDDPGVGPIPAGWDLEGYMLALGAGYAVYEHADTRIELTGGIRYWDVKVDTNVGPLISNASTTITDPFVGARIAAPINDAFSFQAQTSFGVGGDSDSQFDISAEIRWKWTESTDLAIGYRYLELEFDKDAVLVDASLYGPYAALNFRF